MIRMDDVSIVQDGEKEDGYTNYKVRATKYFEHPIHYSDVDWMVRTELEDLLQRIVISNDAEEYSHDLKEALRIVIKHYKTIYED